MARETKARIDSINTVTAKSLSAHLMLNAKLKQVTYINGPAGVGKTEIVRDTLSAAGFHMLQFIASEMLPEDMGGIPVADHDAQMARRLMPDVIARVNEAKEKYGRHIAVFLDEINNGAQAVMAACFKLLHEGEAGGYRVPDGTVFVAAGNPTDVSSVAQELPAPLLNRFAALDYNGPTLTEWEQHALSRQIHPAVLGFVKYQPQFLIDKADFNSGKPTPTPRSWMAVSSFLHEYDLIKTDESGIVNRVFRMEGLAARVGSEAARLMEATLKYSDKLISWEEIKRDPAKAPVTTDFAPAYMQAVALVAQVGRKNTAEAKIAMTYARRLPREVLAVCAMGLSLRPDGVELRSAFTSDDYKAISALPAQSRQLQLKQQ